MRFPLSMTAGMASYIARNKFRPNPEWQKTVVTAAGRRQPVPHRLHPHRRRRASRIP